MNGMNHVSFVDYSLHPVILQFLRQTKIGLRKKCHDISNLKHRIVLFTFARKLVPHIVLSFPSVNYWFLEFLLTLWASFVLAEVDLTNKDIGLQTTLPYSNSPGASIPYENTLCLFQ